MQEQILELLDKEQRQQCNEEWEVGKFWQKLPYICVGSGKY